MALLLFFFIPKGEGGINVCNSGGNDRDMNKNAYSSHSHIIESFQTETREENKRPTIKHMDNCTTREKKEEK